MSTGVPHESLDPLDDVLRTAFPRPACEPSLQPGSRIGNFELLAQLGQGSMGVVWQAVELALGRRAVALKFVLPGRFDQKHRELFAREARAAARLNHPSIVAVHSFGSNGGLDWMAMELVPGARTLRTYLDELKAAEEIAEGHPATAARLVLAIAEAMQVAHDAGVIHRDLKPQNILLTVDGRPKVTDFGLARILDEPSLSKSGEFAGTYFYASPEQVHANRHGIDHRTDIFSLGVVLYELLTLQRPFQGDTSQQVAAQILVKDPPDPRSLRSRTPRDLAVITARCLEKERERRFGSMTELADELRRHLSGLPIRTTPPSAPRRLWCWIRRHPLATTVALFVAVLIAGVAFSGDEFVEAMETRRVAALEVAVDRGFDHLGVALFEESELAFREALGIDPESLEAHAGLVLTLLRARRNEDALALLEGRPLLLERHPGLRMLREYASSGSSRRAMDLVTEVSLDPVDLFLEAEVLSTLPEAMSMASLARARASYDKAIFHSSRARPLFYQGLVRSFEVERQRRRSQGSAPTFTEALAVAEAMLALWPDDPGVRLDVALARQVAGQIDAALAEYAALRPALEDDPVYWSRLASCLREGQKPAEALQAATRSAELSPRSAEVQTILGACLADTGQADAALQALERAVELDPRHAEAYFRGSAVLDDVGRTAEAIAWLHRGIASEPRLVRLQYNLGGLLLRGKLLEEAERAFRTSIAADPEFPEAHCNLAISLARQGRFAESLEEYRLCDELGRRGPDWGYPSGEWVRGAESVVAWAGIVSEANRGVVPTLSPSTLSLELIEVMRFLRKHGHQDAAKQIEAGMKTLLRRDVRETERFWLAAAELVPDLPETWANLSYVYLNSGRPEQAARAARRAVDLPEGMGMLGWLNLSGALVRSGDFPEALEALERAIALDVTGVLAGFIERWHADYQRAAEIAARPRTDPDWGGPMRDENSRLMLAVVCHGVGLHEQATRIYAQVFASNPSFGRGPVPAMSGPFDPAPEHRVEAIACALDAARSSDSPASRLEFLELATAWWREEIEIRERYAQRGSLSAQELRWQYSLLHQDPRFEVMRVSSDPVLAALWQRVMAVLE